jgi:multicomponent Na+:H+ antiporter subunit D
MQTALPILIPLLWMIILIFNRSRPVSRIIGVAGSIVLFLVNGMIFRKVMSEGIQVLQMGGWIAPYGISLVIDPLSAGMLLVTSLILLCISIYSISFMDWKPGMSRFYIFFFSLTMGLNGAFISGDVFNLFVWFELILISSFVLITYGSLKAQLKGGIKYLALNLLASFFFLAGIGLLYGKTGSLNMAHLAWLIRQADDLSWLNTPAMMVFLAFGIKSALFPLFFWLPASYPTPNITITALFAGLLTKAGVYVLLRLFTLIFIQDPVFWHSLFGVAAGATMLSGGMAAMAQNESRRILSYHIISQIGYMVMGLAVFTPLALAGAIFFVIHNMIAKTNAFLVAGMIEKVSGSFQLKELGGLYKSHPQLAVLFLLPAFALAGIPPISGFFAKFILIKSGIEAGAFVITAVAVLTAMLTLFSMIKIWNEAFLKTKDEEQENEHTIRLGWRALLPSAILGLASLLMGIFARPVYLWAMKAAEMLYEPARYIEAVLGI